MTVLRACGLSVVAGAGSERVPVLRDLDFSLMPGEVLGVVGESGAGKSMLGRAIAAALPPGFAVDGGTLAYGSEDLVAMPPARRRFLLGRQIAFIPQEPMTALNPVLSVGQQMREHLRRLAVPDWRERAVELLESVQLRAPRTLLGRYPHQLSGGECQRVLIAMAFASDPRLVIADEPTTALDVTVQAEILELIRALQARVGTAVVFITHDLRLAGKICDELLVLYAGRPVETGAARRVFARPAHPYTRCLQLAAPAMAGARHSLFELKGQMPGLRDLATLRGCRFAPRCPVALADCGVTEPRMLEGVACSRAGAAGEIAAAAAEVSPGIQEEAAGLLQAVGLGRIFSVGGLFKRHRMVAAQDVSFVIGRGEFVGLVGESGSGKSTVARMVMGLEKPSAGHLVLQGQRLSATAAVARRSRLAAMQMVFQDPQSALNPRRRIRDIVTQALHAQGAGRGACDARAEALARLVGLAPELLGRTPAQLSGGQRQRVNIARALCVVPRLLVADEIVSGLDVSVQAQLLGLPLRLRAELGFAMLFISHDLAVVRHLCSRVLVMHQGRIVEQGATEAVFAAPAHATTKALIHAASD